MAFPRRRRKRGKVATCDSDANMPGWRPIATPIVSIPKNFWSCEGTNGNIFFSSVFLIPVGGSDAVDLFVNQICHSHLQTRFPT